jgi:MOSC domain-containing protein YiiM
MARLLGIAIHKEARGEMVSLTTAVVTLEQGVADDFRGKPGKRQVTLLTREGWEAACAAADVEHPWHERRANLFIEGLELQQSQGRVLQIGELRLLITQETDPCNRMEQLSPGLFAALAPEWRGGVCCSVIAAGEITVGDEVMLIDDER